MHDPFIVTHLGYKSSPHRPFCRCLLPAAYIIVVVVMPKSLSVRVVIEVSVIVLASVAMKPERYHLNGRVKNISQPAQVASIMRLDKVATGRRTNKK
jgi:hypothetical protein